MTVCGGCGYLAVWQLCLSAGSAAGDWPGHCRVHAHTCLQPTAISLARKLTLLGSLSVRWPHDLARLQFSP